MARKRNSVFHLEISIIFSLLSVHMLSIISTEVCPIKLRPTNKPDSKLIKWFWKPNCHVFDFVEFFILIIQLVQKFLSVGSEVYPFFI